MAPPISIASPTPQHPRHFPLCLDPRMLTSCHRNHLNSRGNSQGKQASRWNKSWFRVMGFFFWRTNYPVKWLKLSGSFSKLLRDPIAFGHVLVFQIIQPLEFLEALHMKHKLVVISQCPHQRLPGPEEPKWRRPWELEESQSPGRWGLRLEDSYGTQANKQDPHLKVKRKWRVFTKN